MSNPTRQRLIAAALELFAQQGIAETTTKQIAEQAGVNEVTLFRHCGNKQGLLLAVLEESLVFDRLVADLTQDLDRANTLEQFVRQYAQSYLSLFKRMPELLRSIVGESGKYPIENQEALGQGIQRVMQVLEARWNDVLSDRELPLSSDRMIPLLNSTLLGYALFGVTTELHGLWQTEDDFIQDLVQMILGQSSTLGTVEKRSIVDLSESLVHTIFQRAQKQGARDWALVYLLFGAGVSAIEIVNLERVHHLSDRSAQVLQITQGFVRQVPVNQWILGKRYGTYQKNPLTQWLKNRKDSQSALILGNTLEAITIVEIETLWQTWTQDLLTLEGKPPTLEQAQQTWCVEMLLRGMTVEAMAILTGLSIAQLTPYAQRAKEKAVLEQGLALDKQK